MGKSNSDVDLQSNEVTTIAILSDIHIDKGNINILEKSIKNAAEINKASMLIIPGDLSDGMQMKREIFEAIINNFPQKYHSRMLITLGNHDVRWYDQKENINPDLINEYKLFNEKLSNTIGANTLCYERWIDGYHFICLNTDKGCKDVIHLSDDSLKWLEQALSADANSKKPVFLMVHEPINRTHWRSDTLGGFGEQHERFTKILEKHPQLVVMTGHIHNGFGVIEIMQRPFGTLVDIPSLTKTENGVKEHGTGWLLKVSPSQLEFEAWDFYSGTPYKQYNQLVKLPQLPVYSSMMRNVKGSEKFEQLLKKAEVIMSKEYSDNMPDRNQTIEGQDYYKVRKIYDSSTWDEIEIIRLNIESVLNSHKI